MICPKCGKTRPDLEGHACYWCLDGFPQERAAILRFFLPWSQLPDEEISIPNSVSLRRFNEKCGTNFTRTEDAVRYLRDHPELRETFGHIRQSAER